VDAVVQAASERPGLAVLELGDDGLLVTWASAPAVIDPPDWRAALRALRVPRATPWRGGVVGWIGYEAGAQVDRQPIHATPTPLPTVALWRWDAGLRWQPGRGWSAVGGPAGRQAARRLLARASEVGSRQLPPGRATAPEPAGELGPRYRRAVRAALHHIGRGDIYQVCLAWEQVVRGPLDPVGAWLALRRDNPARRGALLRLGDRWLLSNSPETFVDVEVHDTALEAVSVPIKGTVPVSAGPAGRAWLERSEKERAELTMIVDLVRNDLGRVARPGSVRAGPRSIRRCGDLLHAEQEVRALLREDQDAVDAFAAAFPPGSVTGAPKVRAMSLIHALEDAPRGPYTGALGLWDDAGGARTSVLIRTACVTPESTRYHVGAGIVAESDPEREWQETRAKGAALGAALVGALAT
jgi:anthranilate/para-aminobenzoate synthase component I